MPDDLPPDEPAALARPAVGIHLGRTDENTAEITALAELLGAPIGLEGLLGTLKWRLRRSLTGRVLGRAVRRAWRFDRYDQRDRRWWPQGMATAPESWRRTGRDLVAVTWYSKQVQGTNHGARVTFVDLATRRYRHVLLVDPVRQDGRLVLRPLHIHAGGLAWVGDLLHVAATGNGFHTFDVRDIMRVGSARVTPEVFGIGEDHQVSTYGHRHVLPTRMSWQARTDEGWERLRYSFLSVDRTSTPWSLVAGEYGRGTQSTRLARFALDPATGAPALGADQRAVPLQVDASGVEGMQGLVRVAGRDHVTVSRGPWTPGDLLVGHPGAFRRHPMAWPMGPEDLDHREHDDTLWTVTEHPWRRWIVQAPRP